MRADFEQRLLDAIAGEGFPSGGGRVLAAVSGGADSVALVCGLAALRGELGIEVAIGHINHQLRGRDSEQDEDFVKDLANRLGIEAYFARAAVAMEAQRLGESMETAGRQLRLAGLADMAKRNGCRYVATGHQMDDQAETVLFRLLRGTGYRGLCGIWPVRELEGVIFVRPMLQIRRTEAHEYCSKRGIVWRKDDSNSDVRIRRNWIRHRLLRFLQSESGADIVKELAGLSRNCRAMEERIVGLARKVWMESVLQEDSGRVVLSRAGLADAARPVAAEVIRMGLERAGCGLRYVNREHYRNVIESLRSGRGCVCLPGGFEASVSADEIIFSKTQRKRISDFPQGQATLESGREVRFGQWRFVCRLLKDGQWDIERFAAGKDGFVEWFDADEVFGPAVVRGRLRGDRFVPMGMSAQKRVGKFLTDARVGPEVREKVCILADTDGILWVCPVRRSERARVNEGTRRVLEIRILPV